MTATKVRHRANLLQLPMLRNSERSTFKKCRWLWDISYNQKRSAKTSAPALRYGSLIHESLARYYIKGVKRGANPVKTFERLYAKDVEEAYEFGWRDDDGKWFDARELGVTMLTAYLKEYGKDEEWEVLVTEHPYATVVNHPVTGKPWFKQVGTLDGVWKHRSKKNFTVIVDHKTAKSISTGYLVMDDQAGSYWTWGVDYLHKMGLLDPELKLNGMMFNFLRKATPDPRPRNEQGYYLNQDGSISKRQPAALFLRHYTWRDEYDRDMQRQSAMAEFKEMEMARAGELAMYKSPGKMNCGGCWLLDACELHETGNDWETFLAQTSQVWNPYDAQEIAMGR